MTDKPETTEPMGIDDILDYLKYKSNDSDSIYAMAALHDIKTWIEHNRPALEAEMKPQVLEQEVADLKKLLKDVLYYVQKFPQNELLLDMAYEAVEDGEVI